MVSKDSPCTHGYFLNARKGGTCGCAGWEDEELPENSSRGEGGPGGVECVMLYVGKLYEVASLFADPPHANSTTR